MINCIAIDDEPLALAQLTGYISRVPFLNLIAACQDAFDATKQLTAQKVDLLFIDINMPDLNGLDFVRSLISKPMVIFTTAYSEYAVEGFKVNAVDYLLKPFEFQEFLKAVDKARKWIECHLPEDETIFVKCDSKVTLVKLTDIKYIEGMSEYVRIFVEGEEKPLMPLITMKRLEETLPESQFMRVHRSYIINLRKVTEVSRLRIIFGNTYIPVGDNYKDKFMEFINSRMMK